jgi:tellurite resistance protein TerC
VILLWAAFLLMLCLLLALDLGVFNRRDHVIGTREALGWTAVWVTVSLAVNVVIYFMYRDHWLDIGTDTHLGGRDAALQFFTGYVVEYSLSLDNIFVIALIFAYFRIPHQLQHRVLFWGIIGAVLMRGLLIGLGSALIRSVSFAVYVFGAFLLLTAFRMLRSGPEEVDPSTNPIVRFAQRMYPLSQGLDGRRFFTTVDGKRAMTPLFLVLLVVENTDVLFALDSIPAIFAVSDEPYVIFTSNICAILGLRSLYFALARLMDKFRYLKQSLVVVLAYVGLKMLASRYVQVPPLVSLGTIVAILAIGVVASIVRPLKPVESPAAQPRFDLDSRP